MNCQDISRIADTGRFGNLAEAEHRSAEIHALTCRQCAAVWAAHAQLAAQHIPPMPAELAAGCRELAALPARTQGRPALRRLTLVGALVALAAAAALLAIYLAGRPGPTSAPTAVLVPAATGPTPASTPPEVTKSAISDAIASRAAPSGEARAPSIEPLPLLLPPDMSAPGRFMDLALQKVVDLHPELVEGPDTEGFFLGAIATRANGTLVSSEVRLISSADLAGLAGDRAAMEEYRKAKEELDASLPREISSGTDLYRKKHTVVGDGRALRAELRAQFVVIADNYDLTRSPDRVLAAVRKTHADLMLPATGNEKNMLTVFLAEDGSIQHEDVQHVTGQASLLPSPPSPIQQGDPDPGVRMGQYIAQEIARRLSVNVDQIGQMGMTTLQEGELAVQSDGSGNLREINNRRVLNILYAWPRRAGETAPVFGPVRVLSTATMPLRPKFDAAAAAKIIQHEFPDVFTVKAADAGTPGVFLSRKGEVIQSGRLRAPNGGTPDLFVLVRQLVPNAELGNGTTWDIKDGTGADVQVVFAWEK